MGLATVYGGGRRVVWIVARAFVDAALPDELLEVVPTSTIQGSRGTITHYQAPCKRRTTAAG